MIDHGAVQIALRAKLATLLVATTGSATLSATSTGFARTAGSFLTDGFARGLEVASSGFTAPANNGVGVITSVSALAMTVSMLVITTDGSGNLTITHPATVAEGASAGRTLTTGAPSRIAYENVPFLQVAGHPYLEEQYVPGPSFIDNDGYAGLLTMRPNYYPRIYAPENVGIAADGKYADAIIRLFLPGTSMQLSAFDWLFVRKDVAFTRGQRFPGASPGWSCVPVTIPLEIKTVSIPS